MNVLISGGGIAGLTTYIALTQKGHTVSLIEKRENFLPHGTGLILAMNAMIMFKRIGLYEELLEQARELKGLRMTDQSGKSLSFTSLGDLQRKYATSAITIKRSTLHKTLEKHVALSDVTFNTHIKNIHTLADKTEVTFDDNTVQTYDLVIIAEGIHSSSRELLLGPNPYRYSGYTCWRAIVDVSFKHELIEQWGNESRIGIVPLNDTQSYIYLTHNAKQNSPSLKHLSMKKLKELFASYEGAASAVLDAMDENTHFFHDDIVDYKSLAFSKDGVVFVGDSAHAMTPNMGQGATMGIEDGVLLSELIQAYPDTFIKQYKKLCQPRVAKIHKLSYALGKLAQVKSPLLRGFIHLMMRLTPDKTMEKQLENGLIKPIL